MRRQRRAESRLVARTNTSFKRTPHQHLVDQQQKRIIAHYISLILLPPPASSIFPPFLLPSLPRRFPLQIFPFSSCHCVQFVPEISPSNKGQIMTKRLCFCVYAIVCACVCFFTPAFCLCIFPVWLSFHASTISSCTSLFFVSFYICVWPSIMLSSCMISFFFYFHPSQTLLHRICLAPSKRKREMRGLFPPLLLFSLHPNYIPLLLRLPFPLLRCLVLGGSSPEKILWHVPCLSTRILYRYSVHFPISCPLLSKFPIHSSRATSDPWCLNPAHYTFPTKLKFIFRLDLLLELNFFFKNLLSSTSISGMNRIYLWYEITIYLAPQGCCCCDGIT